MQASLGRQALDVESSESTLLYSVNVRIGLERFRRDSCVVEFVVTGKLEFRARVGLPDECATRGTQSARIDCAVESEALDSGGVGEPREC